jgi:hypothetical protein
VAGRLLSTGSPSDRSFIQKLYGTASGLNLALQKCIDGIPLSGDVGSGC